MGDKHVSMPADDVVRICGNHWEQPFDALVWRDGPVVYLRFQEWNGPQDLRGIDDIHGWLAHKTVAGPEKYACPLKLKSGMHPELAKYALYIPGTEAYWDQKLCCRMEEDSSAADDLMDDVVETLRWLHQRLDQRMRVADECTEEEGYGEYVWFELEQGNPVPCMLRAKVPQRTAYGNLRMQHVPAEHLPSTHIPGFEVVRFVRRTQSGPFLLMDRPWEPNASMTAWNPGRAGRDGEFYNDTNIGSREYLEGRLSVEQAGYIAATHVIMRRV